MARRVVSLYYFGISSNSIFPKRIISFQKDVKKKAPWLEGAYQTINYLILCIT
nr:MAG TPA: hypothetical protein [Caudoviricetes sp.]